MDSKIMSLINALRGQPQGMSPQMQAQLQAGISQGGAPMQNFQGYQPQITPPQQALQAPQQGMPVMGGQNPINQQALQAAGMVR